MTDELGPTGTVVPVSNTVDQVPARLCLAMGRVPVRMSPIYALNSVKQVLAVVKKRRQY